MDITLLLKALGADKGKDDGAFVESMLAHLELAHSLIDMASAVYAACGNSMQEASPLQKKVIRDSMRQAENEMQAAVLDAFAIQDSQLKVATIKWCRQCEEYLCSLQV